MYIASRIKSNIRELEGSLIRLIAYASLTGRSLTIELAQEVLRNVLDHDDKAVTIEQIQKFVADYYQLKLAELKSRNNSKSVAMPRQVAMYLCKMLTHASLPGDRPQFRRQAPLDGDSLDQESRGDAEEGQAFNSSDRQPAGIVQVRRATAGFRDDAEGVHDAAVLPQLLWTFCGRLRTGETRAETRCFRTAVPQKNPQLKLLINRRLIVTVNFLNSTFFLYTLLSSLFTST